MRHLEFTMFAEAQAGGSNVVQTGNVILSVLSPSDTDHTWQADKQLLLIEPDEDPDGEFEEQFPEPISIPLWAVRNLLKVVDGS